MGLGATPASGSEVYLTWTNTATNETGFTLTRATDSLFTQNVVTETLASAPYYYTDAAAGLSPGNTYYYKIAGDQLVRFVEQLEHGVREHPQLCRRRRRTPRPFRTATRSW